MIATSKALRAGGSFSEVKRAEMETVKKEVLITASTYSNFCIAFCK
jgi:hypothetical protein